MDMRYILEVGLTGLFAGYIWGEEGLNNWVDSGAMYQDGEYRKAQVWEIKIEFYFEAIYILCKWH